MVTLNLVSQSDLTAFVEGRGYRTERVFNSIQVVQDGAALRVVGLTLLGPRGNKGFVSVDRDGLADLDCAKLWCDGVDYATGKIAERRAKR